MNAHLISSLARLRRNELLYEAARRRLIYRGRAQSPLRKRIAHAVNAMGYAALTLGDAIAGSR